MYSKKKYADIFKRVILMCLGTFSMAVVNRSPLEPSLTSQWPASLGTFFFLPFPFNPFWKLCTEQHLRPNITSPYPTVACIHFNTTGLHVQSIDDSSKKLRGHLLFYVVILVLSSQRIQYSHMRSHSIKKNILAW